MHTLTRVSLATTCVGASLAALVGGILAPPPAAQAAATSAQTTTRAVIRYVALGDSFTSGVGVAPPASSGCGRSTNNYANKLARGLHATSFRDVSCLGATTSQVRHGQMGLTNRAQRAAVSRNTTVVTIGLGGNDENLYSTLVTTCPGLRIVSPGGAPCAAYLANLGSQSPQQIIARTGKRMEAAIRDVQAKAPRARVLIVGYPVLAPARGRCSELPLAAGDYAYVHKVNGQLNTALRSAAQRTGAQFVDVGAASVGHDACSAHPWVNAANASRGDGGAYHPTALGHTAMAQLLRTALR